MTDSTSAPILEWEDLTFDEKLAIKIHSERSFLNFTRLWFEILQGDKMRINWHHRMVAGELEKIIRGTRDNSNLILNMPPGSTKTEFVSIHMPAYINVLTNIGEIPRFRNLNVSFSNTLVKRNSRRTRDIISSPEYQTFWPCEFGVNQAEEWQIVNNKGKVVGETVSRSTGGQITGGRGGYLGKGYSGAVVQDDPDKPEDMFSTTKRESSHRRQTGTLRSRRGDRSKENATPFLVCQQRLHVEDVSGFLISGEMGIDFDVITVPALVDRDYIESLPENYAAACWKSIKDSESRVISGVEYWSYWPEAEHIDDLIGLMERDEYTFWSQYQQKPKMLTGGLIDTDCIGRYEILPFLEWRAIYVDTNSGKVGDRNDYTVFTLCGKGHDGNMYIIDVRRGKWTPSELQNEAEKMWRDHVAFNPQRPAHLRYMKIEDKQAGQGLIADLVKKSEIIVEPVQRGADMNKVIRHQNCQPHIKAGKVFIPLLHDHDGKRIGSVHYYDGTHAADTEWVIELLAEMNGVSYEILMDKEAGYDDQYDTIMDAIDDMLITGSSSFLDYL